MNGRVAKRIRRAAAKVQYSRGQRRYSKATIQELKREYRALPYHRRKATLPKGVRPHSHREAWRIFHAERIVDGIIT